MNAQARPSSVSRRAWATLIVLFFLVSAACGGVVELPQAPANPSGAQPQSPAQAPAQDAGLDPLEPLPDVESLVPEPTLELAEDADAISAEFEVGDVVWTLLQTAELGESLVSDTDEIDTLVADGRLIGVRFDLRNAGSEAMTFTGLTVIDEAGTTYDYEAEGLAFIVPEEACEVVILQPGDSVTCTAIYDVAADATPLYGVLTDLGLLGTVQEQVDLGL